MVQYKKREKRRHYFENFQLLQKVVNIEATWIRILFKDLQDTEPHQNEMGPDLFLGYPSLQ